MVDTEKVVGWVRVTIAYAVWVAVLLVAWRVVLSLDLVKSSGFALEPFQSTIYAEGLPWILFIDVAFYILLMITLIALGSRLKREIAGGSRTFSRLGTVARLGGVLGAVILGYYAFDDLAYPPLYYQDVPWAYNLLLWVLVLGVSAAIVFELISAVILARRAPEAIAGSPVQQLTEEERRPPTQQPPFPVDDGKCPNCGEQLPVDALFCGRCGTKVSQSRQSD